MTPSSKQFKITRAQIEALRDLIPATMKGSAPIDSGEIDHDGVRGSFLFQENVSMLTVTIIDKPRWMMESSIWKRITNAIADVGGSVI